MNPRLHDIADAYLAFVDWRQGLEPSVGPPNVNATDLPRYWDLEYRLDAQGVGDGLLRAVRDELIRSSEAKGMLYSLESTILHRLGRPKEAGSACDQALAWLEKWQGEMITARGHRELILERCRLNPLG